jgi:hypothetical protein
MKETTWSNLRELWAIRRRCKQIKLDQRQRWKLSDQTTGGSIKSTILPTGLTEVRFENI